VVVRDLMRYMSRRKCSHWTLCEWNCARMRDVRGEVGEKGGETRNGG
jgi:hypothetical protein